ncbi:beta-lactamase domain protein [Oscillochloris trichoides DG-6]|uniref:Beta-lactamase domain protein n=1 Tax=Oscillochloris trichoides DG-6 TaxID=765420 RepID=E1IBK9_9CHLR|nr:MBL fold metallo-hydrolase [Oscillochloris trichoides]EFO81428.1 beta-lactamase domain protein [Oscillochloris trichoides DG-6]
MTTIPDGVITIDDMHLGRPEVIATFLLTGNEPTLVDPGPDSTLPTLEAGLAAQGLAITDIRNILLTHIHLDHAGATGTILARNPHVKIYVHNVGAQHIIDPSRLIKSATQLYGSLMETLWGNTIPVPSESIITLDGGEMLDLGGRTIHVFDAPGHAKHHLIYLDQQSGGAFIGDNGGVRLPNLPFVRPATPPPDIDLEAWDGTLLMLDELMPNWVMLTHFGAYNDVDFHISQYRERLAQWGEFVRQSLESGASEAEQLAAFEAMVTAEAASLTEPQRQALINQTGSLELSWRGLVRYWRKRAEAA